MRQRAAVDEGATVCRPLRARRGTGTGKLRVLGTQRACRRGCRRLSVDAEGEVAAPCALCGVDREGPEEPIARTRDCKERPPGRFDIHDDATGHFTRVYDDEKGVLDGMKEYMRAIPAYEPTFFRVAEPAEPAFAAEDLHRLLPINQKETYSFDDLLARVVDGSEHMEFKLGYGPEIYAGLVKLDGMLVGVIGNRQGLLPKGYPEYADYPGIGGKLYRQGLIRMNEFVTLCGRDRVPVIWFQDTGGIDVGDIAEKAELLGLGQSLIYSIQSTDVPMMLVVLRKGTAAAHYMVGGPTANRHNAFTLGTAATEIYMMHGETAAVATYARRAVKDKDAGKPLGPIAAKMNEMTKKYYDTSRPDYCARHGFVDEIVDLKALRGYLKAFAGAVYQNPASICPRHQILLPRVIRG
jgi:glutaconyl-CoA decarboxylase